MKCPFCLNAKTRVLDSRDMGDLDAVRRRRECLDCGKRFTTYERIEMTGFTVADAGGAHISPGDWLAKDAEGKFYPIRKAIFEATYEAVER